MTLRRPESLADQDFNETAWATMNVLLVLLEHGGVLSTAEVASRAELGRDATRRLLRTLAAAEWVRRVQVEGAESWSLGPELPRIGVQWQELLVSRMRSLRADFDRVSSPATR